MSSELWCILDARYCNVLHTFVCCYRKGILEIKQGYCKFSKWISYHTLSIEHIFNRLVIKPFVLGFEIEITTYLAWKRSQKQGKKDCKTTAVQCNHCFSLRLLLVLARRLKWLPGTRKEEAAIDVSFLIQLHFGAWAAYFGVYKSAVVLKTTGR